MRRIAIGSDHAGFLLKETLIDLIQKWGYQLQDYGTHSLDPVDYPDSVRAVCEALRKGDCSEGIILCGSGVGACVVANKFPGIRAALCHDTYSAHQSREHDDCNVLCMGPRVIGEKLAQEIAQTWLKAEFTGEDRHVRRLNKLNAIEKEFFKK
jgi:ribose 5-phosphate isomerase B